MALERTDQTGLLQIHLYVTGPVSDEEQVLIAAHHELGLQDPITGLRAKTFFGRPPLDDLFENWKEELRYEKIGVFFCGSQQLGARLESLCDQYSSQQVQFHFHEESF